MAEGTRDYKRLKAMLKELDQKREKDMLRVEGRLDAAVEGVDARLDAALAEIKTLINGMTMQINGITLQQNEIRSQMLHRDHGGSGESILGQPTVVNGELQGHINQPISRYAKLEFPRF